VRRRPAYSPLRPIGRHEPRLPGATQMGKKRSKSVGRVYQRENGRYYADLRSYADVLDGRTGKHVALVAPGEKLATRDRDVAAKLAAWLVEEFEARRRGVVLLGRGREATLSQFAGRYLVLKKGDGKVGDELLTWYERQVMPRAAKFFGADRPLQSIDVQAVRAWIDWLYAQRSTRNRKDAPRAQTMRHHLNARSNMYGYAQQEGVVAPGYNPVKLLMVKPCGESRPARWLELTEAARFLAAAQGEAMYPVFAALLLTGGRKSEVLGLELEDVDFERRVIRFRPNAWRGLKTRTSTRTVPLWPQLEAVLRPHVAARRAEVGRATGGLLFPTFSMERDGAGRKQKDAATESMITDMRCALKRVAKASKLDDDRMHLHAFRHTYCAARLQTLDGGKPVSTYTVACELGHGSEAMVRQVYGHLGEVRHRAEVVEYVNKPQLVQEEHAA
jgi:integrase